MLFSFWPKGRFSTGCITIGNFHQSGFGNQLALSNNSEKFSLEVATKKTEFWTCMADLTMTTVLPGYSSAPRCECLNSFKFSSSDSWALLFPCYFLLALSLLFECPQSPRHTQHRVQSAPSFKLVTHSYPIEGGADDWVEKNGQWQKTSYI